MQTHPHVDLADDAAEPLPPPSSRRTKLAVAGVAMASAGALALTPVIATPTLPDVQVDRIELARTDAYAMTASWNPLQAWQATFDESSVQLEVLFAAASATFEKLSDSLSDPEVQHRLTSFLRTNFEDPMTIPNAVLGFGDKYGDRIQAALDSSSGSSMEAITGLFGPRQERNIGGSLLFVAEDGTVVRLTSGGAWQLEQPGSNVTYTGDVEALEPKMVDGLFPTVINTLVNGKYVSVDPVTGQIVADDTEGSVIRDVRFIDAFGDANLYFLMDFLGDSRADALGITRIPGDFLESIGAETLGRILGTSWMDTDPDRPGWTNAGLLSRTRLGNLARALIAPQVTTIFQTVEILDDLNNALQANDYELAFRTVVDAPAKITNAFLNGYQSPTLHGTTGDPFPGLFSSGSTLNFIFNEVPNDIANVLKMQRPGSALAQKAITSTETGTNLVNVQTEISETEDGKDDTEAKEIANPAPQPQIVETDTEGEGAGSAADPAVTDGTEEGTGSEGGEAKPLTSKDRISLLREQSVEKRAERVEQREKRVANARDAVERVGSNIRKGLGLPDRAQKPSTPKAGNDGGNDDSSKSESSSKSKSESKSDNKSGGSDD